jgi:hypothetical protein
MLKVRKTDRGENFIMMNFTACIFHRILFRVIKSRMLRWAGHAARMGEGRGIYKVFVGRPEGKRPLGRHRVGGRITLRWTLGR